MKRVFLFIAAVLLAASAGMAEEVRKVKVIVGDHGGAAPARMILIAEKEGDQAEGEDRVIQAVPLPEHGFRWEGQGPQGDVIYQAVKMGEYWLGLECGPVSPELRAHVELPKEQGILVRAVMPDSPAAKAGLKEHDILLRAGDKKLKDVADLIEAVNGAEGKALALLLIHEGKEKKIEVTPAKRPENLPPVGPPALPGELDRIKEWTEQLQRGGGGTFNLPLPKPGEGKGMQFRFFGPGAILPPGVRAPKLPGNVSIAITRSGDNPAQIVVKRGDDKWEVTEKELDKLPSDIRPHVERMLDGAGGATFNFVPDVLREAPAPGMGRIHVQPFPGPESAERFEAIERKMERMQKQMKKLIDELHERKGNAKPAPEKEELE